MIDSALSRKLDDLFDDAGRHSWLGGCYRRLVSDPKISRFLDRYVEFNSMFAPGVTSLASAIHMRDDILVGPPSDEEFVAGSSAEVASFVFHAAEDEYHVKGATKHVTHRTLAVSFGDRVREHLGVADSFGDGRDCEREMHAFVKLVKKGYGAGRTLNDRGLFHALGFHLASERCADQEFRLLDQYLRSHFTDLVQKLRRTREPWGTDGYHWIEVHCSVERDHWAAAEAAIALALDIYRGGVTMLQVYKSVADGFRSFVQLQTDFFDFSTSYTLMAGRQDDDR